MAQLSILLDDMKQECKCGTITLVEEQRSGRQSITVREEDNSKEGSADMVKAGIVGLPISQEQKRSLILDKAAARRLFFRHLNLRKQ